MAKFVDEISYGFEHVAIKQKKNICKSRLDTNIESEIVRGIKRPIPLIASNMSTVCNSDFCIRLYNLGALGIMHRAASEEHIISEINCIAQYCFIVAASIGIGDGQFDFAKKLVNAGANILVIDIAHGYCDEVIELGRKIKNNIPNVKIILGNTTNVEMLREVSDFCDGLKVGIAQGMACETKNTAGCTEKMFSVISNFYEEAKRLGLPIISDGSIREPADFVKAIGAGACSVMAGSIFARCPESAAEQVEINGKIKKIYAGMASRYVQEKWRGGLKNGTCPEGKVVHMDIGESVNNLLERYSGALRSGITYAGGKDIKSFQENVEFIRIL